MQPYRHAEIDASRLLPSISWTRVANVLIAIIGCISPTISLVPLLGDHDCSGVATPHVASAIGLMALGAGLAYVTLRASWWITAWGVRHARPFIGASCSFVPTLAHFFLTAFCAAWIVTADTFHLCFGGGAGLFPFGC